MSRSVDRLLHHISGWIDEQQIENDDLYSSFQANLRELMAIYSGCGHKMEGGHSRGGWHSSDKHFKGPIGINNIN